MASPLASGTPLYSPSEGGGLWCSPLGIEGEGNGCSPLGIKRGRDVVFPLVGIEGEGLASP